MDKYARLFKGIHGDLTEFVDLVSSVLGCPVTLEDANHRLLAYSIHDNLSDPVRIATITSRRVPEKVINALWKEGYMPALLKSAEPVVIPSLTDTEFSKRAAISIRKNNEVLGFIWALESTRPFSAEDLSFLSFAAREAKNQLLQVHSKKKRHLENNQELVWQLLTGHFETEEEITLVCSERGLSLPSMFSIVVFRFHGPIDHTIDQQITYMLSTTQKLKVPLWTIDQSSLIVIASPDQQEGSMDKIKSFIRAFISGMKGRFGYEGIKGASGHLYRSYSHARNSYDEALYTLKLQQFFEDDSLLHYGSLGMYQLLDQVTTLKKPDSYYRECLHLLKEYDRRNQANLHGTLHTYLKKDSNPHEAAKELHLHVNTVHYRLKRIKEITNIDLKDPLQKMALHFELLLQFYESRTHKSESRN
ncbi:MAG: helix-turn-helix domain-containing protein [Bacillus sp. (in: firmicutes)]